jgi:hypothetical protein
MFVIFTKVAAPFHKGRWEVFTAQGKPKFYKEEGAALVDAILLRKWNREYMGSLSESQVRRIT